MGGLSKKAYQLSQWRAADPPSLTVDAGGLLFGSPSLAGTGKGPAKAIAAALVKAYGIMGYDAVGIAANDLAAGLPYLQTLSRQSRFPWLSANLVAASDHHPLFQASVTRRVGAITVGIIGLTDPAALPAGTAGATILPWQEVLPDLVGDLSSRCDLLILLSSLSPQENRAIASTLPTVHILCQTERGAANTMPEQIGNTLITNTGKQGKYLGRLCIDWRPSKRWGEDRQARLEEQRRKLEQVEWQLKKLEAKGGDVTDRGKDPQLFTYYQSLSNNRRQLENEITILSHQDAPPAASYQAHFQPLAANLPDDAAIAKLVSTTKAAVLRLDLESSPQETLGQTPGTATTPP